MLKSCKYCGKIHDSKFDCGKKPKPIEKLTLADRFRKSSRWTNKSKQIRQRDNFLCQCCIRNLPGTYRQYEYENLEVHHVEPINQYWDRRLDDDNLITLCRNHHEMAEAGEISRDTLMAIIEEQESNT